MAGGVLPGGDARRRWGRPVQWPVGPSGAGTHDPRGRQGRRDTGGSGAARVVRRHAATQVCGERAQARQRATARACPAGATVAAHAQEREARE